MFFRKASIVLLVLLNCICPGNACMMHKSIHVLENEYFSNCCRTNSTVNWYKEQEGNWILIQGDGRINPNGTCLQFWQAVQTDSGKYICQQSNGKHSVSEDWKLKVHKRNKGSCFNVEHVASLLPGTVGESYTIQCDVKYHNAEAAITWYKDCSKLTETKETLYLDALTIKHSGKYTCLKSFVYDGKRYNTTHTVDLIVKAPEKKVKPRLTGPGLNIIKTEIGKEEVLNCTAFIGKEEHIALYWLRVNETVGRCQETDSPCQVNMQLYDKDGETYAFRQLRFKSIKEEDIISSYTCVLLHSYSEKQAFILQKESNPDLPLHVFTPGITTTILFLFGAVLVTIPCVIFRVDLVLVYRDITGKDETMGDGKIYDAFVSYLKDSIPICEEQRFTINILLKTLEEHFGYKLCIFERDISPGGAIIDDFQSFIDKSRRLIIILSKNYTSDKVMLELETGLHKALVERKIKVILIEYVPRSNFDFLPQSLKLLSSSHVLKWEQEKSLPLNSRFWKKLRYAMPAKPYKMKVPAAL